MTTPYMKARGSQLTPYMAATTASRLPLATSHPTDDTKRMARFTSFKHASNTKTATTADTTWPTPTHAATTVNGK